MVFQSSASSPQLPLQTSSFFNFVTSFKGITPPSISSLEEKQFQDLISEITLAYSLYASRQIWRVVPSIDKNNKTLNVSLRIGHSRGIDQISITLEDSLLKVAFQPGQEAPAVCLKSEQEGLLWVTLKDTAQNNISTEEVLGAEKIVESIYELCLKDLRHLERIIQGSPCRE